MVSIEYLAEKRGVCRRTLEKWLPRLLLDGGIDTVESTGRGNRILYDERQTNKALDKLEKSAAIMRNSRRSIGKLKSLTSEF